MSNISHNSIESSNNSNKSNWPEWLIDSRNQIFFSVFSLALSFMSGIGIFTSIYYLFYLDKTVYKPKAAKRLNIAALILPIVAIILYIAFIVFIVLVAENTSAPVN